MLSGPLMSRVSLALLHGSVAKGLDTVASDIDLLVVADHLMLEEIYSALAPVEAKLARTIDVTLYSVEEFAERRAGGSAFLTRVLADEHFVLIGDENAPSAA